VQIDGFDILENPSMAKRQIGFLPEIPPLYRDLTVDEQLDYACRLKGIPNRFVKDKILEACRKTDVSDVRGRLIKNLSKGYRQRVGLAQAMLGDPKLLILDEPTSGLDPLQANSLREVIRELGKEQAVLLSSHILSEVTAVCRRLLIMNDGALAADGEPESLAASMNPKGKFLLRADGDREKIRSAVLAVPAVESCEVCDAPDGEPEFILQAASGADIAPGIFYAMAELDAPIRKFTPVRYDLEQIFLQLTRDRPYEDKVTA
jgi:ABC-2 type transport system ATP-binding protein